MGNCRNLFLSGCSISFSSETDVGFSCLTSSSVFHIVRLLNFNHSCEYAVLSHEILICIFLMTNMKLIFYVFICHLCIFIGKGSVQIICPYFFVGGGCFRYQSSVSYAFCKYFLKVCGLSFHFLNGVIWRAEIFYFKEAQFINFLNGLFCHI